MFTPHLSLISEGKNYTLLAVTEVPNETFSAGKAEMGAPDLNPGGAGVMACQLQLAHSPRSTGQVANTVEHRIRGLSLKPGDTVTAFVMLDGRVLGSSSIVLSDKRPPLTSELCQRITVQNTPRPGDFTGPTQLLVKLGIVDDTQAGFHRSGIQQDLNAIGWNIAEANIQTGPDKSVRDCSNSVQNNAF